MNPKVLRINDKHFEVTIRKMSDKIIVESVGDTSLIPGDFVTKARFEEINAEVLSEGGEPATGRQVVLGITKVFFVLRFMALSCIFPGNNQSSNGSRS